MTDLLRLTAELMAIPSASHHEDDLVDHLQVGLDANPVLDVERVGKNLVARTHLGRSQRLILAGHTDTVVANGNEVPRIDGDNLWGLGAADMKSGLAVLWHLARTLVDPAVDVSFVFYAGEEVEAEHNGLGHLFRDRPDLVAGDAAILCEPTGAELEAGCQGSLRVLVSFTGQRAHTARPWMGRNAIHRLAGVLARLESYEGRRAVIDGCEYREALQAVKVEGGVAGNVVPDRATLTLNHRFAPDRTSDEAEAHVREVVGDSDAFEVVDVAPAAAPGLGHPLLRALIDDNSLSVRAKLGWTDVARFAALGIPAVNFGPGDSSVAHTAAEMVTRADIERVHQALAGLLRPGG